MSDGKAMELCLPTISGIPGHNDYNDYNDFLDYTDCTRNRRNRWNRWNQLTRMRVGLKRLSIHVRAEAAENTATVIASMRIASGHEAMLKVS